MLSPVAAATTIVLTVMLMVVKVWSPYRSDWSLRGDDELRRDLGHALAYAGIAMNVSRVLFLVAAAEALASVGATNALQVWPDAAPGWVQIVLCIVVGDLLEYLYHRASHTYSFLWRLHAIHHTPVRLHVLKAARHHAAYALGRGVFVWVPLLILGASPDIVVWQFIAVTVTGLVAHANVAFAIPALAHRLAVTPEYHRVHHADDLELGSSNFAAVFPVRDILFRTHVDPLGVQVTNTGVRGDRIPRRFLAELKWPLWG